MKPIGLPESPIWLIGDFPSVMEYKNGTVFSSSSGAELRRVLDDVGLDPDGDCFFYNVSRVRPAGRYQSDLYKYDWFCTKTQHIARGHIPYGDPQDNLRYISKELAYEFKHILAMAKRHRPRIIIGLGELPLLCFGGKSGIMNWRGSCLEVKLGESSCKFIPTIHPEKFMKQWEWRYFAKQDIRRAKRESSHRKYNFPETNYVIRPDFSSTIGYLDRLIARGTAANPERPLHLGVDIETRFRQITCLGIAESPYAGICIPFVCHDSPSGYWSEAEELAINAKVRTLLTLPDVQSHGQNFNYDMQYMVRQWGFIPTLGLDTMTAWHVCYSGLPKALAFICSMMLPNYVYWKDEGYGHAPDPSKEDQYWTYNIKDACRTLELVPLLEKLIDKVGQRAQYEEQMAGLLPRLRMMMRGVKRDVKAAGPMILKVMEAQAQREEYFQSLTDVLVGDAQLVKSKTAKPWYRSPPQQVKLFYEIFNLPVQRNKHTKRPTTDNAALDKLKDREPLLAPVFTALQEYRSLGVFLSTFLQVPLDWDRRMRCSYGCGMTETFRDTSSEDAFGFGGNMQNIPKGTEE